ncbi:unnamed protein product, partial [Meganyctiphanes norvegica]
MTTLPLVYLIPVLALCFGHTIYNISSLGGHGQINENSYYRALPCPNPEDIAPCGCSYYDGAMSMSCMDIEDEDELYKVFHSLIPIPTFGRLTLPGGRITTLNNTVFGDATFESVYITCLGHPYYCTARLTTIGPNTFMKSASTLRHLEMMVTRLSEFPFDTLSEYEKLDFFMVWFGNFPTFPIINSESLQTLVFKLSSIREIQAHALDGLPNLTYFDSLMNPIDVVAKDVFAPLPNLQKLNVQLGSRLRHLHSHQFAVTSANVSIQLYSNDIESVGPDTFSGENASGSELSYNTSVFIRKEPASLDPNWETIVHKTLPSKDKSRTGNNLTCGCDIAWLVLEPTYHPLVPDATCHSGELLVGLDPSFYEIFC